MTSIDDLQLVEIEEVATMPPEKSIFEARDPGPVTDHIDDPHAKKYMGPERRRDNRRQQADRRDDVRFDLKATDRRQKSGRRQDDKDTKFW